MPRASIAWRDVWIGAVVTALLFTVGKFLIGLYLGKSGVTSGFGAAGSMVVLLIWVYYSAQIFLLGAEFTWVYAHRRGSRLTSATPAEEGAAPHRGGSVIATCAPSPTRAPGTEGELAMTRTLERRVAAVSSGRAATRLGIALAVGVGLGTVFHRIVSSAQLSRRVRHSI
jgi:hypothetical protein